MLSQRPDPTNSDNVIVKDEHLGIDMYVAKPGWKKGEYKVEAHPHAQKYFPHLINHPELHVGDERGILETRKSAIAETLQLRHDRFSKSGFQPKMRFEFSHTTTQPSHYGDKKTHHFNVIDHETGEHLGIASNTSSNHKQELTPQVRMHFSQSFAHDIDPEVLKAKTSDSVAASDVHSLVKSLRAEKGKIKSFTGNKTGSSEFSTYNTPHEPEEASRRFEEHMRKNDVASHFVRHSPTHFSFKTRAGVSYSEKDHHVFATPGAIHHHTTSVTGLKPNTTILESFKKFKGQK